MTREQLVAALTSEIEELRLAIRAEQLQPDGAISPEWVPAFRGYVRMLAPERRLRTSAFNDGRVLVEYGAHDDERVPYLLAELGCAFWDEGGVIAIDPDSERRWEAVLDALESK